VAIYGRVSTDGQTVDQQMDALREIAVRSSWEVVSEFTDTVSGTKFTRSGLDELMRIVRCRKIDLILCHKLDRLGRSLVHLAQLIGEFEANGVALFIPGQGIDTRDANPAGKLQMNILMAVAEFERSLISERTKIKLQALKRAGVTLGRPNLRVGFQKVAEALFGRVYSDSGRSPTVREMAIHLKVSLGTAHTILKQCRDDALHCVSDASDLSKALYKQWKLEAGGPLKTPICSSNKPV